MKLFHILILAWLWYRFIIPTTWEFYIILAAKLTLSALIFESEMLKMMLSFKLIVPSILNAL